MSGDASYASPNTVLHLQKRNQNPLSSSLDSPSQRHTLSSSSAAAQEHLEIAFQGADPRPFAPRGFHPLQVQYKEFMSQASYNAIT
jgi:hypothetical protein